ncbi:MAG: phenylacetate-CoA oxygenase/reductase subunit PaaK [Rhodospirillales bacterium]|nr:phenylacetate-CoA oxygenase/reductase subunit PaaK [Rhodospirillales bacterium]
MARFHDLTITDIRPETDDAISVAFRVPDDLADAYTFDAGQHLTLRADIDGEDVRRCYSICSGVNDGELRVAIKRVPDGAFSAYAHKNLHVGDSLQVMTPTGKFRAHPDVSSARTYAAFAAGSGITPVISIMATVLDAEPDSRFFLFYGNRSTGSVIFRDQIDDLKNRHMGRLSVFHILSNEDQDSVLLNGRIDGDKVPDLMAAACPASDVDGVFVCGPGSMIPDVTGALKALGVADDRVHFELFATDEGQGLAPPRKSAAKVEAKGDQARVTVVVDGVKSEFAVSLNDGTILDSAVSEGIDLPYSCKGGMCTSCRAKLVEGKVDMAVNYGLEPWELEAGFVLTCQSRPLTDKVVLDFDEM